MDATCDIRRPGHTCKQLQYCNTVILHCGGRGGVSYAWSFGAATCMVPACGACGGGGGEVTCVV